MIKRTICLLIIFAMCLSFAACSNSCSSSSSSDSVVSQVTSEGSSQGDDSSQDSSSSEGAAAQEDDSASQSNSGDNSGSGSDNADDNSGTDSNSDTDGANNGSGSDNGGTTGTQTGAGSAQSGFAITKQPVSTSVAVGAPLTLSVSASGSGTLTYKWYTSLTNSYNGIELVGQTGSSVSIYTANPFTQYYYCVITQVSTGATLTTNIATASAVGSAPTPVPVPVLPTLTNAVDVWVKGVQITPANYTDVLGDGTHSVYFNGDTNTLTLNGANVEYDGTTDLKSPIHADLINLTINLTGNSTVKSTGGADSFYNGLDAIYSTGAITMEGPGTLTAIGGDAYNVGGSGIYAGGGLTIFSGTINATGGEGLPDTGSGPAHGTATGGEGIYTPTGISVTIGGGTINVTGGYGTNQGGNGINSRGSLYIFGNPTINIKGGNGGGAVGGFGIYTSNEITLGSSSNPFNGSLTVIYGEGDNNSHVFAFNKNITVSYFGAGMKYYTRTSSSSKWSTATNLDTNTLPKDQDDVAGVLFEASS